MVEDPKDIAARLVVEGHLVKTSKYKFYIWADGPRPTSSGQPLTP